MFSSSITDWSSCRWAFKGILCSHMSDNSGNAPQRSNRNRNRDRNRNRNPEGQNRGPAPRRGRTLNADAPAFVPGGSSASTSAHQNQGSQDFWNGSHLGPPPGFAPTAAHGQPSNYLEQPWQAQEDYPPGFAQRPQWGQNDSAWRQSSRQTGSQYGSQYPEQAAPRRQRGRGGAYRNPTFDPNRSVLGAHGDDTTLDTSRSYYGTHGNVPRPDPSQWADNPLAETQYSNQLEFGNFNFQGHAPIQFDKSDAMLHEEPTDRPECCVCFEEMEVILWSHGRHHSHTLI